MLQPYKTLKLRVSVFIELIFCDLTQVELETSLICRTRTLSFTVECSSYALMYTAMLAVTRCRQRARGFQSLRVNASRFYSSGASPCSTSPKSNSTFESFSSCCRTLCVEFSSVAIVLNLLLTSCRCSVFCFLADNTCRRSVRRRARRWTASTTRQVR